MVMIAGWVTRSVRCQIELGLGNKGLIRLVWFMNDIFWTVFWLQADHPKEVKVLPGIKQLKMRRTSWNKVCVVGGVAEQRSE